MTNRDRPKVLTMRTYLVKVTGVDHPLAVEADHRGAARHYVKSVAPAHLAIKGHYGQVEWARLKRS